MSESRPAFRFTQGEWAKHRTSDFKPLIVGEDTDRPWISASVYLASGDKIIAEVGMWTPTEGQGWPRVDNIPEMKANLALMSAAPNMLDVLERIQGMDRNEYRLTPTIYDMLEAAIAKATTY